MIRVLHRADARTGDLVRRAIGRSERRDLWIRATTDLGSLFVVAPTTGALWWRGRHRLATEVATAGLLAWLVSQTAKHSFDRKRPYEREGIRRLVPPPSGSSLPSGHSAVAVAVATVLAGSSRRGRRWPWALMGVYVPVTRVHLGVHYPSDTAAGAAMGWGIGAAVRASSRERR